MVPELTYFSLSASLLLADHRNLATAIPNLASNIVLFAPVLPPTSEGRIARRSAVHYLALNTISVGSAEPGDERGNFPIRLCFMRFKNNTKMRRKMPSSFATALLMVTALRPNQKANVL
jgi:hypothetical protein